MSYKHPTFSIITPSYNQAPFIEQTLLSVRGQDYPNLEHIVIDGGSTDGTLEILSRYQHQYNLRWISETDEGQSHAINKGLKRATGEIIGWLNSDDTYLPGTLQQVAEYFERDPDIGWLYGDGYVINETSQVLRTWKARPFDLKSLLRDGQFICQPAAFFRRRALTSVGPIDQTLHFTMDYDLFIRLGTKFRAAYLPEPLATRRIQKAAKSSSQATEFYREALATLDKAFSIPALSEEMASVRDHAYANVQYQGGKRLFEERRLQEARACFSEAWRLLPAPFSRTKRVIGLLLVQCILGIQWMKPRSTMTAPNQIGQCSKFDLPTVAWPEK